MPMTLEKNKLSINKTIVTALCIKLAQNFLCYKLPDKFYFIKQYVKITNGLFFRNFFLLYNMLFLYYLNFTS